MLSILDVEKVKNPIVAAIAGGIIGATLTWVSAANIHEERVKTLEAIKIELERQVTIQEKLIANKDKELNTLSSKVSTQMTAATSVNEKPGSELRNQIVRLDDEIHLKKRELARNAELSVTSFSGKDEKPKSDEYVRIEKELQALYEQRNLAGKNLIDILSKQ